MTLRPLLVAALFSSAACAGPAAGTAGPARTLPLDRIKLPPGFSITLFADDIPDARSLALGEKGTVFVGNRSKDKVYAIEHDGKRATRTHILASGLNMPNGVAFREGALYVAEVNRILRYDGIETRLADPPKAKVFYGKYPGDRWHGWKFIAFGPDGWLYVPVGAPCNICEQSDPYASITRIKPDGSFMEVYARGVRNSVGFDWHPDSKELYFTDNGRDNLGDESPPCEFNHAPKAGLHFGFPYCHAEVKDPEFGSKRACAEFVTPVVKFRAHTAPLGMRFYTGSMFPAEYRGSAIVAQHGSWNRTTKIGYQLVRVRFKGGAADGYEIFAQGWLNPSDDSAWGRPVDVLNMPDGSLLVSDDHAGVIYRITYQPPG